MNDFIGVIGEARNRLGLRPERRFGSGRWNGTTLEEAWDAVLDVDPFAGLSADERRLARAVIDLRRYLDALRRARAAEEERRVSQQEDADLSTIFTAIDAVDHERRQELHRLRRDRPRRPQPIAARRTSSVALMMKLVKGSRSRH